jgi:hypothetical protein
VSASFRCLAGSNALRGWYHRAAGSDPALDAALDVINCGVDRLLREELADKLGPVAAAADDDDRLIWFGDGLEFFGYPISVIEMGSKRPVLKQFDQC